MQYFPKKRLFLHLNINFVIAQFSGKAEKNVVTNAVQATGLSSGVVPCLDQTGKRFCFD